MTKALLRMLDSATKNLEQAGLYKAETIVDPRAAQTIDLTRYDYLALGADRRLREAAAKTLSEAGAGVFASRAFSGTRAIHRALEKKTAQTLGQSDAVVFHSGYAAHLALFSSLFDSRDSVLCDAWVQPSIVEGIRLSGAGAVAYRNNDIADLKDKLKRSRAARFRAIVTDGVFAFSGRIAQLAELCELAERYDALLVVDDSLGLGVLGDQGRGTTEHRGVHGKVDVVTGSFGTVLGGAGGGFVAGRAELVAWLKQKATAHLFGESLSPPTAAVAHAALSMLEAGELPIRALRDRVEWAATEIGGRGLRLAGREHPNLVVEVGPALTLHKLISRLFERGILATGLCHPVVAEHASRLRIQISLDHEAGALERAVEELVLIGRELRLVATS